MTTSAVGNNVGIFKRCHANVLHNLKKCLAGDKS